MLLHWPHEVEIDTTAFDEHAIGFARKQLALLKHGAVMRLRRGPKRWEAYADYDKGWFELFNNACPAFDGKYWFTQAVRQLGYDAPDSVVVHPHNPAPDAELLEAIRQLDTESPVRLCKPLYASRGDGLFLAPSPAAALRAVRRKGVPYLVMQNRPPRHGELRYGLHRTAADLAEQLPPSIRIAATKLGPHITGDGTHTVRELIALRRQWPMRDRRKLLLAAGTNVPARGEQIDLVNSGNISRRLNRFSFPDPQRLARLDVIMLEFLRCFEAFIGGTIATICFDVAWSESGVPTFYEMQVPFGNPYGKRNHGTGRAHRAARLEFTKSMYLSGRA